MLLAVAAVLCAASTAACSTSTSTSTPDSPGDRLSVTTASPKTSYTEPGDIGPMLFPSTGAETRFTQGLDGFLELAQDVYTRACGRGGDTADGPPPMFVRRMALPDLVHIQAHGFSSTPVPRPPVTRRATAVPCDADTARAEILAVKKLFVPLQAQWWNTVDTLDKSPEVRRAFEGLRTCLPAHGVAATDEDAFFGLVDSRLNALDGEPRAAAREDRRLGAVYARCMAPVETVREKLREQRRVAFLDAHSAEVERLRAVLPERLRQLEERYGIRYGVPVP
ncbi:hypothetical protein [Streptomyces sp. bgisy082]|uniref:hypothetical protein n=1 Tax=Streptomyces sp. bgisy082 TaxID=3413776 RepID=UPI003D74983A